MSSAAKVKQWRHETKRRMVAAFGGRCGICGYDRCIASLDFHHVERSTKEFSISKALANPTGWGAIVPELRKCVMICRNCHGEVHNGAAAITSDVPRFDERYGLLAEPALKCACPVCGSEISPTRKTCSNTCSGVLRSKIQWDDIELGELIGNLSYVDIAKRIGCTDNAVIKRAKKLGIYVTKKRRGDRTIILAPPVGLAPTPVRLTGGDSTV